MTCTSFDLCIFLLVHLLLAFFCLYTLLNLHMFDLHIYWLAHISARIQLIMQEVYVKYISAAIVCISSTHRFIKMLAIFSTSRFVQRNFVSWEKIDIERSIIMSFRLLSQSFTVIFIYLKVENECVKSKENVKST